MDCNQSFFSKSLWGHIEKKILFSFALRASLVELHFLFDFFGGEALRLESEMHLRVNMGASHCHGSDHQ